MDITEETKNNSGKVKINETLNVTNEFQNEEENETESNCSQEDSEENLESNFMINNFNKLVESHEILCKMFFKILENKKDSEEE